jgi:NhaP-type Na+/H+ or K+/H+ antiporter
VQVLVLKEVFSVGQTAFYQAAVAVALGMAAQTIAVRLTIPSIVILLVTGVLAGPDGVGLLDPAAFGTARTELVALAVTVILFEGGLALRLENLRRQQRSLTLLLTVGGLVSMAVGAAAAHSLLDMPWTLAALYGALVIVTGPTVVTPLLSRLTLDRSVRELLISEGVLIDPIGATVAIVAADYVVGHSHVLEAGWLIFARLGVGGVLGAAAGVALAAVLRRGWIPNELRNPAVLGAVLLISALASRLSSEAGLMAAVVQGVVMANTGLRELGRLRQFKEEITVLLLSFMFVLLAADLRLDAVRALGWQALAVVAILMWVARPLAVFACTVGSDLNLPQRLFVAWICPRGIVAAAVVALFSIWLAEAQIPGGDRLEALVFVTVAATVTVQGLSAGLVARLLGVDVPTLQGTIIVGADHFGRLLAHLLVASGRQVVLMDTRLRHCQAAQREGLSVYQGDALDPDAWEEAGARYADTVVALTRNGELNTLIGQRVRDNFRVERILTLGEESAVKTDHTPFPRNFPGVDEVNREIADGHARLVGYEVTGSEWVGKSLAELPYGRGEFALFLQRRDRTYVAAAGQSLAVGDHLLCFQAVAEASPLAGAFTVVRATPACDEPAVQTRIGDGVRGGV